MLEFDIRGYADTRLTPIIYVVQSIWCVLVLVPFLFIVRCWYRYSWIRTRRTAFTVYLSGIDSASRLIYIVYYVLRLYMIYHDQLWMVEDDHGRQAAVSGRCVHNSTLLDQNCAVEDTISRQGCLTFSLFLYWASTWPMSSVLLLQIHALVASIAPVSYDRISTLKFCFFTMLVTVLVDVVMGVVGYKELQDYLNYEDARIMDGCKFEYFSRLSINSSWYVFALLLSIGVLTLVQLGVSYTNRKRRRHFTNPVANSPVHGWCRMSDKERRLTLTILTCSIVSFIFFIIHFIVYLVEGNSVLREVISITVSVFAFFGPVELMWFNIDLRKAVFISLFSDKRENVEVDAADLPSTG